MYGLPPPQGALSLDAVLSAAYPVGSIYISTRSTNPGTTFGIGTWEAFGQGRVLVGLDSTDEDFDEVEYEGGEKTHQLTVEEMPQHTHSLEDGENHVIDAAVGGKGTDGASDYWMFDGPTLITDTGSAGEDDAHNNLQPYVVVYMWKRTA